MSRSLPNENGLKRKRKHQSDELDHRGAKKGPIPGQEQTTFEEHLSGLEAELSESPEDEGRLSELLSLLNRENTNDSEKALVAVALCRAFTRLMTTGALSTNNFRGLGKLFQDYQVALRSLLGNKVSSLASTWIELQMRTLNAEAEYLHVNIWKSDEFNGVLSTFLERDQTSAERDFFIDRYLKVYHDFLFHFCQCLSNILSKPQGELVVDNAISILSKVESVPIASDNLTTLFVEPSRASQKPRITPSSLKRAVQSAWLAILRSPSLSAASKKNIVRLVTPVIFPWFLKPELLMDFLTDVYDLGGSQALMALSGLYKLISTKNLDYPSFYPKLYSLLDAQLLHSTHRSRFFRLLQTFLSSTHLPATLVASFVKRLARLALLAPPAAIVALIPYTYNLLKTNPAITFMIHRSRSPEAFEDPFDPTEPDPLLTNAIDSSLWELESLRSHYHPNVASIARIISEQFTKQQYNIEDFLDHSYSSMMAAELERDPKKAPVVEWKIPKTVFRKDTDNVDDRSVDEKSADPLLRLWSFDG